MKTVLCFGESKTWGCDPATQDRFPIDIRWTGVVAKTLGSEYRVIEERLNGPTTLWDDPIEGHRNGQTYLPPCLTSHKPIGLATLMLGTNDLKTRFSVPTSDITHGTGQHCDIIDQERYRARWRTPTAALDDPASACEIDGVRGHVRRWHRKVSAVP
ncbi:TPA: hydrolase [Candidatus Latescibacteria bacterium]|nr:hydrolase [Candidatus Latescibacterota bacterium]|tara:strand:+ start:67 stop:537 length:471 start_codon:yes stop_codon:yes gene_type:complete